jgi:hypothetical protein
MNNLKVSNSSTSYQGSDSQEIGSKHTPKKVASIAKIIEVILSGLVGYGISKAGDAALKNGEFVKAMSPSAQDELNKSAEKISRLVKLYNTPGQSILYGNDPLPLGIARTTKKELEGKIASEYRKAARTIENDSHNITLNNLTMGSVASQVVTILRERADRIQLGKETPGEFYSDNLHSMNDSPARSTDNSIAIASSTVTKGYQQANGEAAANSSRNLSSSEQQIVTTQETNSKADVSKVVTLLKNNAAEVKRQSGLDVNTDEGLGKAIMQYWKENNLDPKALREQLPDIKDSELATASAVLATNNATEKINTKDLAVQR